MEPQRVLIVEAVSLPDGRELPRWSYVWKMAEAEGGSILVEHRDREYRIPADRAVDTPVPSPPQDRLVALDPCFENLGPGFEEVLRNNDNMFAVHRCPHGRYFLEDARGGIAMYTLWIFLGEVDDPSVDRLERLWSDFHRLPSDAIFHLGLGR